jgi:thiosulfate reductase cytochrome b subunit
MAEVVTENSDTGHATWVRVCHWLIVFTVVVLVISGVTILAVHPRLYWGEAGNHLLPAWLELPLSNNHRPDALLMVASFADAPASAVRDYSIFNQNGWARSLHFLAAWIGVVATLVYLLIGVFSGHVRRNLVPRASQLAPRALLQDAKAHIRGRSVGVGPPYGYVQKICYVGVVFIALPLMLVTGLAMSPAVTAALPVLLDVFGGYQSARSIHFLGFSALVLFIVIHVAMVVVAGFGRQMRAMIWEKRDASS